MRILLLSLVPALSGCGAWINGRYTNPVPFDTAGGGGGQAGVFIGDFLGDEPAFTLMTDIDGGEYGWRVAGYYGGIAGFADQHAFFRAGLSPFSIGHRSDDPDPDPWVGVSATMQVGYIDRSETGDNFFEAGVGLAGDIGWTGAGGTFLLCAFIGGGIYTRGGFLVR